MTTAFCRLPAWLAVFAACAGCVSTGGANGAPALATTGATAAAPAQTASFAEAPAGGAQEPGGRDPAIWRDAGFRRRLAESYVAESDVEPRLTTVERDAVQEVLAAIADDKTDVAMALLQQHRTPAASAVFDFLLGNLHFEQERFDEAAVHYRAAIEKHSRYRRAWQQLGTVLARQNDLPGAIEALSRQVQLGGGDTYTYGMLGAAHLNVGNAIAAETAYRMAALLDPRSFDWRVGLVRALHEQRRYADTAAMAALLVEQHPERADLWLLQANALLGLEKPREAAQNLELVDRLGQSTAETLGLLGDIYVTEQFFDLAAQCYARALEAEPEGKVARALRGARVLAARGAVDETRSVLDAVQRRHGNALRPDDRKEVLRLEARVAAASGAGEQQAKVLEQIVALDPLDGDALIRLGQYSQRAGDAEKAVFWFERASSIEAFEADAKVGHAQVLVGQSRYADALPLLRRAQALKPRENIQKYLEQVERAAQAR